MNIVDFIDNDDISTPFHFYPEMTTDTSTTQPQSWVFGTELPHVLLNEALAEFQEHTSVIPRLPSWYERWQEITETGGTNEFWRVVD